MNYYSKRIDPESGIGFWYCFLMNSRPENNNNRHQQASIEHNLLHINYELWCNVDVEREYNEFGIHTASSVSHPEKKVTHSFFVVVVILRNMNGRREKKTHTH